VIPRFNSEGLLPGDVQATIDQIVASHLVTGAGLRSRSWDREWRAELVENLRIVSDMFWKAGAKEIVVDGSFLEMVDRPGDIDAYFTLEDPFDLDGFEDRLNQMDGDPVWTWDRYRLRSFPDAKVPKLPFWGKYHIDIFPDLGQPCGIKDRAGRMLTFPQAFRQQRGTFRRKGVLLLVP
jgi:hypothetical protein